MLEIILLCSYCISEPTGSYSTIGGLLHHPLCKQSIIYATLLPFINK
jgi:hypothetical protein